MRFLYRFLIMFLLSACAQAKPFDDIIKDKKADVGIAFADDTSYWENSSHSYPLMSVFKLHIAVAVLDKVNGGDWDLRQKITVSAQEIDSNTWSPLLKKYPATGFKIELRELLYYMVAESDNNACDVLIDRLGGLDVIQKYVKKIGLENTVIKVTEAQMQKNKSTQYQNTASLKDTILLLKKINNNELFAPRLHKELISIMQQTNTGANKIKKYLPQSIQVAHKTGSSSRINNKKIADNDIAILKNGEKTYYLVVFVTDSLETDDANAEIIATIAKTFYALHKTNK